MKENGVNGYIITMTKQLQLSQLLLIPQIMLSQYLLCPETLCDILPVPQPHLIQLFQSPVYTRQFVLTDFPYCKDKEAPAIAKAAGFLHTAKRMARLLIRSRSGPGNHRGQA